MNTLRYFHHFIKHLHIDEFSVKTELLLSEDDKSHIQLYNNIYNMEFDIGLSMDFFYV